MSRFYSLLLLSFFYCAWSTAQIDYGIDFPNRSNRAAQCNYFEQAFQNKSKETSFVIQRVNNKLFFETTDERWFKQLFKNAKDGVAVDIVSKSRYDCDTPAISSQIKGKLLAPVYASELKRGLKPHEQNRYRVAVGEIPISMLKNDLEFNILFLNNNRLCKYYTIFNLASYPWDLLDMGVYLDSITYSNEKITSLQEQSVTQYKTLKFVIPFEKNKSVYDPSDIKPLYDSLRLTDFNIKTIDIKAYASVEGSEQRNTALQKERGNSIAASLQTFQTPQIQTKITTAENWVEFFNDIRSTPHADFQKLSKKQIKSALTGTTASALEPILAKHRKAVVTLQLDKIDIYKDQSINNLTFLFNEKIATNQIEEARIIQNSLLEKIKETGSPDAIEKIEIPNESKYVDLRGKNYMYQYLMDKRQTLIVYNKMKALESMAPNNSRIQYNLVVLKFIIWRNDASPVDHEQFKKQIKNLHNYGFKAHLIDRMLVNYYIVRAEQEMRLRNYKAKDQNVFNILGIYNNVPLTDRDYLSLAQFLTYYAQSGEATRLLEPRAKEITIDEDLLFYYLNLTLIDKKLTETDAYRNIMLNAVNLNKQRYCELFNPSLEDGVTFQLLEDDYLKKSYCENCVGTD